jgi:hypothetical protein
MDRFHLWLVAFCALCCGCLTSAELLASEPTQGAAERAADASTAYASAWLIGDGGRMAALLDQSWVRSNGGERVVRKDLTLRAENLRRIAMMPLKVTLGMPRTVSTTHSLYVIVPVRNLARGFPHDVESTGYFAAISRDNGKTWRSLDTACADALRTVFKDYPIDEVVKILAMDFDPARTIMASGEITQAAKNLEVRAPP